MKRSLLSIVVVGCLFPVCGSAHPGSGIVVDTQGNAFVSEWTNAHSDAHDYRPRVRIVGRDGKVKTLATVPE